MRRAETPTAVLAAILWLVFGPRVAAAEIIVELAVGAALLGGGGGGRVLRSLRELRKALPDRRLALSPSRP